APVEIGRILDSKVLRSALAAAPGACLALAVSSTVFNDVVREAYTTFRAQEFREVRIAEKEYAGRAWLWVPGHDTRTLDLAGEDDGDTDPGEAGARGGEPAGARPPNASTSINGEVVNVNYGTIQMESAVFGIRN
ncbi:hypothetical protein ACWDTB_18905, partial [Streptomyces sp. NPDC003487]